MNHTCQFNLVRNRGVLPYIIVSELNSEETPKGKDRGEEKPVFAVRRGTITFYNLTAEQAAWVVHWLQEVEVSRIKITPVVDAGQNWQRGDWGISLHHKLERPNVWVVVKVEGPYLWVSSDPSWLVGGVIIGEQPRRRWALLSRKLTAAERKKLGIGE